MATLRGIQLTRCSSNPILLYLSGTRKSLGHSKLSVYILQERPFNDRNPAQVHKSDAYYPPNGAYDGLKPAPATKGKVNAFSVPASGIYEPSTNHIGLTVGATASASRNSASDPMMVAVPLSTA